MKSKSAAASLFILFLSISNVFGYKILGLFPFFCRSHMVMFRSIMEELVSRGHVVHVLSHFPRDTPLANYTDLSIAGSMPILDSQITFDFAICSKFDVLKLMEILTDLSFLQIHEAVIKSDAVQKLLKSDVKYDLIILEPFLTDMMLGFVYRFKVPSILLTSSAIGSWTSAVMANPQNPAFVPVVSLGSSFDPPKMTFLQRFRNTVLLITKLITWYGLCVPTSQNIMNKYFGDDMPPLLDIYKNASLVLTNTHPALTGGRPLAPTVIDVGGVHIKPPKRLPLDIEKFIEESSHGVVYFSMGSVLRTASLSKEKTDSILHALSKLKERVLWKYEEENLSVPDNILLKKWMPQRDILAHPNVKLFITHGGMFGIIEAVSEGKPIVGIPVFADQKRNVLTLELQAVAKFIDYSTIDSETIYEAVQEMLKPQYADNAKELSKLFHDRPMSPMDTAIYWIEYVIRNNGARILRSTAVDLPYYQYLLIDVILFFLCCLIGFIFIGYYFLKLLCCRHNKLKNDKTKLKGE